MKDGDAVTDTKELGKRLREKVEAEAASAENEQPAPGEPTPTPEPPPEPTPPEPEPETPEAKATATMSAEQQQKAFDRAVSAFHEKLCKVFEVEELTPSQTPGVIGFLLPGFAEKRPHEDFKRCPTCNGWGKVLTQSLDPQNAEVTCPDPRCKGRGYWQKASAPEPVAPTMVPLPSTPASNGGEWGEAPAWMGDPRLSTPSP